METFQAAGECVGNKTPTGWNFVILAFADHLHAHKPITHTAGKGKAQHMCASQ